MLIALLICDVCFYFFAGKNMQVYVTSIMLRVKECQKLADIFCYKIEVMPA